MENPKNENTPEKEWAKKMLELDLSMESGAIWTDFKDGYSENENAEKEINEDEKFYYPEQKTTVHILKPDPIKYGNHIIMPNVGWLLE